MTSRRRRDDADGRGIARRARASGDGFSAMGRRHDVVRDVIARGAKALGASTSATVKTGVDRATTRSTGGVMPTSRRMKTSDAKRSVHARRGVRGDAKPVNGALRAPGRETARAKASPAAATTVKSIDYGLAGTVETGVYPVKPLTNKVYENADGMRVNDGRYTKFQNDIKSIIPEERIYTDPVKTFAYGTDASFYRLLPQAVVKIHNETEVKKILPVAAENETPVTFRAAGTSLSGQAVSDSILLKLSHTGQNFRKYEIKGDGSEITVEPGLILGEVNRLLQAHKIKGGHDVQYKMGPDPSSIDSCMIGGVVANNSSGMCCGVSQNTYHTLKDMRIVFVDGTVLDTSDQASRESFMRTHKPLVEGVQALARRVQADEELTALIKKKFAIKCTTGYSINALVDHPGGRPDRNHQAFDDWQRRYARFREPGDVQDRRRPPAQGERVHRVPRCRGCVQGCGRVTSGNRRRCRRVVRSCLADAVRRSRKDHEAWCRRLRRRPSTAPRFSSSAEVRRMKS